MDIVIQMTHQKNVERSLKGLNKSNGRGRKIFIPSQVTEARKISNEITKLSIFMIFLSLYLLLADYGND